MAAILIALGAFVILMVGVISLAALLVGKRDSTPQDPVVQELRNQQIINLVLRDHTHHCD